MQLRLSGTYWRFLFLELAKLLAITGGVIVTVGAFALALKPFADGLIGPVESLWLMLYFTVPMLQYALPFAAGFGATLVYHRAAQDNEILAAMAGGISHRAILLPALLMGLLCGTTLFLLADQAIPKLLFKGQELLTRDVSRLVSAAVDRHEALVIGDAKGGRQAIFAEQFTRPGGPPPAPAYDYFILSGVLAVELDQQGRVQKEATAKRADVWLYRQTEQSETGGVRGVTTVVMQLSDTIGSVTDRGIFDLSSARQTFRRPDALIEDPKYLSWAQMRAVRATPELMQDLDRRRRELAAATAERTIATALAQEHKLTRRLELTDGAGRPVLVACEGLLAEGDAQGYGLIPLKLGVGAGTVEVTSILEDGSRRIQRAKRAWLSKAKASAALGKSTLELRLQAVSTSGPMLGGVGGPAPAEADSQDTAGTLSEYTLGGLVARSDPLPDLLNLSIAQLLDSPIVRDAGQAPTASAPGGANAASSASNPVALAKADLAKETADMMREISSKLNERFAASFACVVTILTGAIMAMRLRDSLPLPVYLWSFLPALGALFCISGGQSVTHRSGDSGLLLLYGGIAALLIWAGLQYRYLARH